MEEHELKELFEISRSIGDYVRLICEELGCINISGSGDDVSAFLSRISSIKEEQHKLMQYIIKNDKNNKVIWKLQPCEK